MNADRKQLESLVWRHTHRDFKGKREDGTRCVNHLVPEYGTCSVPLASLTDAELLGKLPARVRAEVRAEPDRLEYQEHDRERAIADVARMLRSPMLIASSPDRHVAIELAYFHKVTAAELLEHACERGGRA